MNTSNVESFSSPFVRTKRHKNYSTLYGSKQVKLNKNISEKLVAVFFKTLYTREHVQQDDEEHPRS